MNETIFIIEDDADIAMLLKNTLVKDNYRIEIESNFIRSIMKAKVIQPDLIILDILSPEADGLEVCKRLKIERETRHIPILILSQCKQDIDIISSFELGADDYMTKPFSPRVLSSRIKSILRRKEIQNEHTDESLVFYRGYSIDSKCFKVKYNSKNIVLTRGEFRLLHSLFQKPGWVFSRKQLLEVIHGEETPVTVRSIDVMIVSLRHKLGDNDHFLETVRGVGYRAKELEETLEKKEKKLLQSTM